MHLKTKHVIKYGMESCVLLALCVHLHLFCYSILPSKKMARNRAYGVTL